MIVITETEFIGHLTDELLSIERFSKEDVYSTFEKYVQNKELLRMCVNYGELHFDYVKYQTIFKDTLFEIGIGEVLKLTQQAYSISPQETSKILSQGYKRISLGLAQYTQRMWSQSPKIEDVRPDVYVKTLFTHIGDMIENSLKPYLLMINELRGVVVGKPATQKKLGSIVDVLMQYNPIFKGLYSELLLGITVSQWRNISDHGDYKYTMSGVEIEYGPENQKKKKILAKDDLGCIFIAIDSLLYMHKTARTLLSIEYHGCYSTEEGINEKSLYTKQDDNMMQMVETAYAYGLTVQKVALNKTPIQIEVNQYLTNISRENLKLYVEIMVLNLNKPFTMWVYRKGQVEYTVKYSGEKVVVFSYIVKE